MRLIYLLILGVIFSFVACTKANNKETEKKIQPEIENQEVFEIDVPVYEVITEFSDILKSAKVDGSILIYNSKSNTFYSNDFEWAETGHLPASTFKIVNSIIGLETGVVESDSTVFKWDGEKRRLKSWEQDLIFRDAFQFSCVPCYQEIARGIGHERMNKYLTQLDYGDMQVDSSNIDLFWLEGESNVSQFQQIRFLDKLYNKSLGISDDTYSVIKKLMLIDKSEDYSIYGKTGWSIRNGNNNGWFVGYIETPKGIFFIATNVNPEEDFNMDMFGRIRIMISYEAFKTLGIM